jgi:hypothetical protein
MNIKLGAVVHAKSHQFSLLHLNLFAFIYCLLRLTTFLSTMSGKANQSSNVVGDIPVVSSQSAAGMESEVASSTSSSTMANQTMPRKEIPPLYQYWKVPMVMDIDIIAYHDIGWLPGVLVCTPTTLDFPMIDRTNIVCFDSHLMCGLGLLPRKILVFVLNYIGCELVHLHPNAISALSCFSILCECWLGILPDTSFFWYFYSPSRYEDNVFSCIGLTLHHNRREEYLKVTFKGCWKGSSQRWFHINLGDTPQWLNKHLLLSLIKDKWNIPEEMPCLKVLIKRVTGPLTL